jgi:AcrR family transcriptional regulator
METSLRERKKRKARLELATVALRLFREKGFDATTVEEIAAAAEYSPSTFFRHFGSKEDVVFLNIRQDLEEFRQALNDPPAGVSVWEHIRQRIYLTIDRFSESGPEFEATSIAIWLTDPALWAPFQRFCADWEQVIAQAWAAAHGAPDSDSDLDAQLIARSVVGSCQAAFHVHVNTGADLQELLKRGFDRIGEGYDRVDH